MDTQEIVFWIHHEIDSNKWYPLTGSQAEKVKNALPYVPEDIEITFSHDYSKFRKTIWKLNKELWKPKA